MKISISTFCGILLTFSLFAQSEQHDWPKSEAVNSIYFEVIGPAILSLNYDCIFIQSAKWRTVARIGLGFFPNYYDANSDRSLMAVPLAVQAFRQWGLEAGGGINLMNMNYEATDVGWRLALFGTFGYRYQKTEGGLVFRVAFTPIYDGSFYPSFGLSIGYAF